MIIRFPTAAATNDNEASWNRGYADGQAKKWSARLANEPGPAGLNYVSGWIAGSGSRPL